MKMKNIIVLASFAALVSCGGGGDSDSGGGGSNSSAYAGTYNGTLNSSITINNQKYSDTEKIRITIAANGTGAFINSSNASFPLSVTGNRVSHTSQFRDASDGVVCTGTQKLNGTISGAKITGTYGGSGNCTANGSNFPFTLGGNFSATKS